MTPLSRPGAEDYDPAAGGYVALAPDVTDAQDDDGHWVAELSCAIKQHMRHDPPGQNRPWVLTSAGRERFLGTARLKPRRTRVMKPTLEPPARYEIKSQIARLPRRDSAYWP